jgi:hypothetical protein
MDRDKQAGESPYQFVRRVYGKYVGRGLARHHLRTLDPSLYRALTNAHWMYKERGSGPLTLPTEREANDEAIERLFSGAGAGTALEGPSPVIKEQLRLLEVVRSRKRRAT